VAATLHRPVLAAEAVGLLAVGAGGLYVDATLGGGGYAEAILLAGAGRVVGLDWDGEALERAGARLAAFGRRATLIRAGFQEMDQALNRLGLTKVDGVVADLGLSSDQLAAPERGFSFQVDGPLDMRMDQSRGQTAAGLLAGVSQAELTRLLAEYGEEPRAAAISRAIVAARARAPLTTTGQLARLVERVAGRRPGRIHPATRTFQALRLAVNAELANLERLLLSLPAVLKVGGRAVIVSYHSLEDRRVKEFFRAQANPCACPPGRPCVCGRRPTFRVLTRRAVKPSAAETAANPRARSARLRAAERVG
jgi:16S rRNA (cytosine1402-N4)-methyltransferase